MDGNGGTMDRFGKLGFLYADLHAGDRESSSLRPQVHPYHVYFHNIPECLSNVFKRLAIDFILGIYIPILTRMRATHIVHRVLVP